MRWLGWFRRTRPKEAPIELMEGSPVAVIGGRARKVGVPYAMPADTDEINRLDFQHYMLRFALQGNYAAPVTRPASILDVGTGTGRWAREVALEFPAAKITAVDITPPPADEPAAPAPLNLPPPTHTSPPTTAHDSLPFPT